MGHRGKSFVEDFYKSDKMIVLLRTFKFPTNKIRFTDNNDPRQMSVEDLFYQLKIPQERLKEIYEYGNLAKMQSGGGYEKRKSPFGFSGFFTEDGKQRSADILRKEIIYYQLPPQLFGELEYNMTPINVENYKPSKIIFLE